MDAGSTFLLTQVDNHLWIVLSDPKIDASKVLLVSVTTATHLKERVCLLNVGDHPWIRHESCVSYEHAKVVKLETLDALKFKGLLRQGNRILIRLITEEYVEEISLVPASD